MPTYSYRCLEDGTFDVNQSISKHARADCPTCGKECKQVMLSAPTLDIWAMAKAGMPGAHELVGNRLEKQHKEAGQEHHYWRDDLGQT